MDDSLVLASSSGSVFSEFYDNIWSFPSLAEFYYFNDSSIGKYNTVLRRSRLLLLNFLR